MYYLFHRYYRKKKKIYLHQKCKKIKINGKRENYFLIWQKIID